MTSNTLSVHGEGHALAITLEGGVYPKVAFNPAELLPTEAASVPHHPLRGLQWEERYYVATLLTAKVSMYPLLTKEKESGNEPGVWPQALIWNQTGALDSVPSGRSPSLDPYLLDEGRRGHLGLGDVESFLLQLRECVVHSLEARLLTKGHFPLSYQLQRLVDGLLTLAVLRAAGGKRRK